MVHDKIKNLRAYVTINTKNLIDNFNYLKSLNQNKTIICMIKANAYGHDSVITAKTLEHQADYFGVASLEEAVKIRLSGTHKKLLVFSGFFDCLQIPTMIKHNIIPVVHSLYQLEMLFKHANKWEIELWLKINSGMNRLGLSKKDFIEANELLRKNKHSFSNMNLLSHLAESNNIESSFTAEQFKKFKSLVKPYDLKHISISNSASSIIGNDDSFDTIRLGISLYGISTLPEAEQALPLKPVMTFKSRIISILKLKEKESVGYNRRWVAQEPSIIAVVPVGYGDGYPQHAVNGTPVLINNIECPLAGRVSMDMLTVDVTKIPTVNIGDEVILWGDGLPIEKVGRYMNYSPYALVTGLRQRVYHKFID